MRPETVSLSAAALIALAGASSAQFTPTLEARSAFSSNYRYVNGSAGFNDVRLGEDGTIAWFGDDYDFDFTTYSGVTTYFAWFGELGGVETGTEIFDTFDDDVDNLELEEFGLSANNTPVYFVQSSFSSGEYRTFDGMAVDTPISGFVPGGSIFGLDDVGQLADGTIIQEIQSFDNDRFVKLDLTLGEIEYFNQSAISGATTSGFNNSADGFAADGSSGVTAFDSSFNAILGVANPDGSFTELAREGANFDDVLNTTRTSAGGNIGFQGAPTGESEQMLIWNGVTLETIVTEGVEVGTFSSFGVDVNDRGDAIFVADNANGVDTLFFADFRGFLIELVSIGDTVFDPGLGTDISITSFSSTFQINGQGDVIARVSTSEGSSIISFSLVPAPGALGLLGVAGFGAVRRRR
ncbi:MAG: PEP-CTERM sorting domain-containing protein [Planctomycetota bacterium]